MGWINNKKIWIFTLFLLLIRIYIIRFYMMEKEYDIRLLLFGVRTDNNQLNIYDALSFCVINMIIGLFADSILDMLNDNLLIVRGMSPSKYYFNVLAKVIVDYAIYIFCLLSFLYVALYIKIRKIYISIYLKDSLCLILYGIVAINLICLFATIIGKYGAIISVMIIELTVWNLYPFYFSKEMCLIKNYVPQYDELSKGKGMCVYIIYMIVGTISFLLGRSKYLKKEYY